MSKETWQCTKSKITSTLPVDKGWQRPTWCHILIAFRKRALWLVANLQNVTYVLRYPTSLRHSVPPHITVEQLYQICSHACRRLVQCFAVCYCTHLIICVRRDCSRKQTSKNDGTHMHVVCSSLNGSGHTRECVICDTRAVYLDRIHHAMCCSYNILQYVAVCCSALQCVAVCCSAWPFGSHTSCHTSVAACCSVCPCGCHASCQTCFTVSCSVVQRVAVSCSMCPFGSNTA